MFQQAPHTPFSRLPLLLSAAALSGSALSCTAHADDAVPAERLAPMVVTAAGVETDPLTAPASVTVITGEELEKESFVDLTDALRNVPGVAVAGGAGAENIYLRGLPAEYTLILIDGKRLNSRAARTNGSGGVDQYFMPPASAIERIEIVRGPMSSLYGSDAMGGVINIITKPSSGQWTGSLTVEATVPEHDEDSSERQQSFYLNGSLIDDTLGLQVWGRHLDRSPSERMEDGRAVGQDERDIEDINARLTWTPSFNHELTLEVAKNDMETDSGNDTITENPRRSASLGYDGQLGRWHLIGSAYREQAKQRISSSRTNREPEITTSILDAKASTDYAWYGTHELTLGSQWKEDELEDQNLGLGSTRQQAFSNVQWALFAEDIWTLAPPFDLTTGARYTHDERFGGEVTPRVYGLWALSDRLYLNGGVSAGYRTPELRESSADYYSCTGGSCRNAVAPGNPDLEPEKSTSYELGMRYETLDSTLTATAFHTDYRDRITTRDTGLQLDGDPRGPDLFEWYNVDEAQVQGIELSAEHAINGALAVTASYTWTDSEFKSGEFEGQPLSRTPEHVAGLRADWQTPWRRLGLWASTQYNGESAIVRRNELVEYDPYTTLDLGATYTLNQHVTLKSAIYNAADASVDNNDNGRLENGRTWWIGLTTHF